MSALPRPVRAVPPDPVEVAARLQAVAAATEGDETARRTQALAVLRETLEQGRAHARARLEARGRGVEVARELSRTADIVVGALWEFAHVHILRTRNPTAGERLSLIATGGYGRGVLAPYSDLDLLFLRPWKETALGESLIEFMLYALWDLGLKVGWASRSIEECVRLAREDMTIRTALLEARWLAGDPALADKLRSKFEREVVRGTAAEFVAAKLAERDARHTKAGASRYLVEPNVKDGKGGLRDLNTLFWIARYFAPESPLGRKTLDGLFTGKEQRAFEDAFDFLWSVRIRLHFAAGRAEERLGFDRQAELAAQMGYAGRGEAPAVERFMRRYFLTAKEVGALTRAFCAKLEADRIKAPQGLSRLLPGRKAKKRKLDVEGFVEEDGRLSITGPEVFERDPVNLLRLFRSADRMDLDLHPDAFTAVIRSLHLVTPKVRRDPEAARAFLDVLARGVQPYRILSLMNDAGLLGRFLPEFGRVVAQTQLNMYHAFTVDEHTLRAVGIISDIEQGRLAEEHPLSASILPMIADREALYLAMLLHDTGKGGSRGQAEDGAIAARRACERLGLPRWKGELVSWLVEHHLVLSDYAQKRDVADPDTVAAFARIVENPERLRLLLVLTVADVRAVGPGVWNGWKGQLMRELYAATEAAFRGGRGADAAAGVRTLHAETAEAARARLINVDPDAAAWAASMEDAYFAAFTEGEQAAHAGLARRAAQFGAAASARTRADRNAAELVLAARDRTGLFADVAATLAAAGADVVGARVFTSRDGQALDVFHLQDARGEPYGSGHPAVLARVTHEIEAAARGELTPKAAPVRPVTGRGAAFAISPAVAVDNEATAAATVVEASGRDRPGLLADLARVLSNAGLSIQSAHVDNYGERAVDAFYVTDEAGGRLTDPRRLAALKTALTAVLDTGETRGAQASTRIRVSRAR